MIIRYAAQLLTAATWEPVSLATVKNHIRVDDTQDDVLLKAYISAARKLCEVRTNRAIPQQTFNVFYDSFYGYEVFGGQILLGQRPVPQWRSGGISWLFGRTLPLPLPPVQSVVSVHYTDPTGTTQLLDPSQYVADLVSEPARLTPAYGLTWPVTWEMPNAVQIQLTCGYASPSDVPETIRLAMLLLVAHWYENREAVAVAERLTVDELPLGVADLLLCDATGNYV